MQKRSIELLVDLKLFSEYDGEKSGYVNLSKGHLLEFRPVRNGGFFLVWDSNHDYDDLLHPKDEGAVWKFSEENAT
jgi:hypothetical protein